MSNGARRICLMRKKPDAVTLTMHVGWLVENSAITETRCSYLTVRHTMNV
jgi:hypothetical protein